MQRLKHRPSRTAALLPVPLHPGWLRTEGSWGSPSHLSLLGRTPTPRRADAVPVLCVPFHPNGVTSCTHQSPSGTPIAHGAGPPPPRPPESSPSHHGSLPLSGGHVMLVPPQVSQLPQRSGLWIRSRVLPQTTPAPLHTSTVLTRAPTAPRGPHASLTSASIPKTCSFSGCLVPPPRLYGMLPQSGQLALSLPQGSAGASLDAAPSDPTAPKSQHPSRLLLSTELISV